MSEIQQWPSKQDRVRPSVDAPTQYWLTATTSEGGRSAEEVIRILVGEEQVYAFGERSGGRRSLRRGRRLPR